MLDFALNALASILFVVDPLGAVPAYLAMSEGHSQERRRLTAWKASVAAAIVLALFAAAGKLFFHILGLTLPAFQVAGGLILFLVALDMLRAQRPTQEQPDELTEGREKEDIALTPLAIPILAGPASLSTVATLMSQAQNTMQAVIVYAAIAVAALVTGLTLQLASPLHKLLGKTGIHVLTRIFGLILAAIAVQFVLNGLREALPEIFNRANPAN